MDTVTHDGKEYKKLAVLAEEFNYTTDYIGQLCRAGKVDARLVGRAWYVYPESLKHHKKNRYQDTFEKKLGEEREATKKHFENRVDVEVLRTKKTTKIHRDYRGEYNEVAIRYESDDGSLLPKVEKPSPAPIRVVPEDATKISITQKSNKKGPTELTPTELPKVYLKGRVPVAAVHERADLSVTEIEEVPRSRKITRDITKSPKRLSFKERVEQSRKNTDIVDKYSHIGKSKSDSRPEVSMAKEKEAAVDGPVTNDISVPNQSQKAKKTKKVDAKPLSQKTSKLLIGSLFLLAGLISALLLGLRWDVSAEGGQTEMRWYFELPSIP